MIVPILILKHLLTLPYQPNYAGPPIYIAALATFKIALCCETLTMIQVTSETTLRVVIKGTMMFVSLSHVAIALALMIYCRPVRKAWNPHIQGKCISPGLLFYGTASVSMVCDLIAFAMPFAILYPRRNINRDIPHLVTLREEPSCISNQEGVDWPNSHVVGFSMCLVGEARARVCRDAFP